ncbi:MAG: CapA family protein [Candidatus Competibacteraceae bacterium]|nr:CapA family protein [Candidatus Competibacteraceae bacterium]
MIFLGDIAHPFTSTPYWVNMSLPWKSQAVIINLEGSLVKDTAPFLPKRLLFNHISILEALAQLKVCAASLANNHIMDLPNALIPTRNLLSTYGIHSVGAGPTFKEAITPASINFENNQIILLAFGWEPIGCIPARKKHPGIAPLQPNYVLKSINNLRKNFPSASIVLLMHWNYEMELYPQPAHRQLAMLAIDNGASAVIGHHPHCVGGIENYRDCFIAYSLGNWWMPQGVYFDNNLFFNSATKLQLAFEWSPNTSPICHWFEYCSSNHSLTYIFSEPIHISKKISELTPFQDMTHKEYCIWFNHNRIKRRALPIYKNHHSHFTNLVKDSYVKLRHKSLMVLETSGLRKKFRL